MFDSVSNILDGGLERKSIVISDTLAADANFLIVHFLIYSLKNNNPVTLVGLEQSFFHYFNIARKLVRFFKYLTNIVQQGVNLSTEQSKGSLSFINGLNKPYDWTSSLSASSTGVEFTLQQDKLKGLYNSISLLFNKTKGGCIIIDSLSVLSNSISPSELSTFVQYCRALIQNSEVVG
jgi:hypothetical protein